MCYSTEGSSNPNIQPCLLTKIKLIQAKGIFLAIICRWNSAASGGVWSVSILLNAVYRMCQNFVTVNILPLSQTPHSSLKNIVACLVSFLKMGVVKLHLTGYWVKWGQRSKVCWLITLDRYLQYLFRGTLFYMSVIASYFLSCLAY